MRLFCIALISFGCYGQAQIPANLGLVGDRFRPLQLAELTPEQKTMVEHLFTGERKGMGGPFNVLLRSPEMGDAAQQFGGQARCLRHHQSTQTEYDRKSEEDDDEHGRRARNSPRMQTYDEGREHEAQEDGQCDRNENLPAKIERGNDQRRDGHVDQGGAPPLREPYLSSLLLQLRGPHIQPNGYALRPR